MDDRRGGVEALEGLDLGRLLASAPLSPAQAAAVGLGILSALEDLREAGRGAGSLLPEEVLVGPDGRVRLRSSGHDHGSSSDQMSELRQAGRLICSALGIAAETDPGALRPAERAMPAVCATARAIANGAMGRNLGLARAQFADTAGSLVAPERLRLSEMELAEQVRSAPVPAPVSTPAPGPKPEPARAAAPASFKPLAPATPAPRTPSDWERRRARRAEYREPGPPVGRILALGGALLVLVVAGGLGVFVVSKLMVGGGSGPITVTASASPAARQASPSSAPAASPQPSPRATLPAFAPPAQGTVKSVVLALNGDCAAGSSCALEITVNFTKAPADTDYAWTFKTFDPCTATTTDVGSGHFTARAGWVQIISDRTVKLPATRGQLSVVAVTTSPDEAQSPALGVGQGSC